MNTFPAPPVYFELYGDKNVDPEAFVEAEATHARSSSLYAEDEQQDTRTHEEDTSTEQEIPVIDEQGRHVVYRAPSPPPLPDDDAGWTAFQVPHKLKEEQISLDDAGMIQLYELESDDVQEAIVKLRKLSHSAMFNFVELLQVLVDHPEKADERLQAVQFLLFNMNHLLNAFRRRQAFHEVKEMLQTQIQRHLDTTQELMTTVASVKDQLHTSLQHASSITLQSSADHVTPTTSTSSDDGMDLDALSPTTNANTTSSTTSSSSSSTESNSPPADTTQPSSEDELQQARMEYFASKQLEQMVVDLLEQTS